MPGKPGYKCAHTPQPQQQVQGEWWVWGDDEVPAGWADDEALYDEVDDADSVWSGDVPPPSPSWPGEIFEGWSLYSEPEAYLRATGELSDLTDDDFGTDAGSTPPAQKTPEATPPATTPPTKSD